MLKDAGRGFVVVDAILAPMLPGFAEIIVASLRPQPLQHLSLLASCSAQQAIGWSPLQMTQPYPLAAR